MPGMLVTVGSTILCPHGGQVTVVSSNARVLAGSMPVATMADQFVIAGCPFVVASAAQPCLRVQWVTPATRVLVNGQPAVTNGSAGMCIGPTQAPQGPAIVSVTQPRVTGT